MQQGRKVLVFSQVCYFPPPSIGPYTLTLAGAVHADPGYHQSGAEEKGHQLSHLDGLYSRRRPAIPRRSILPGQGHGLTRVFTVHEGGWYGLESDWSVEFLRSCFSDGANDFSAASAVILFDQDFNPHNDKQAQDRAYRIGQKRDVDVVKLITRGTIEEDMLKLGQTKLALDDAVAGDNEEGGPKGESAPEREMKTSLMSVLRKQFEQQNGADAGVAPVTVEVEMADGTV